MKLHEFFQRQPRPWLIAESFVLCTLIAIWDYVTGREVTLFLLYAAPIFLVSWYGSRNWGLFFALFSAAAWHLANQNVHQFVTAWGYGLATVTRLAYFIFIAIGSRALSFQQEASRARIQALEHSRELEKQILEVSEHEQRRIGQELHDGLCQYLAAIACAAKSLRDDLETRALPEASDAGEIERLLNEAVGQTRNLARGIFPVQMDEAGLAAALEDLVTVSNRLLPITVSFETHGEIQISDPQISMHLYRIAQEALNNAMKHGDAQRIVISLHGNEERLQLQISDDGCGFRNIPPARSGMGFKTMQYRARSIGGELGIGSLSGSGSTVTCTIPLLNKTTKNHEYAA